MSDDDDDDRRLVACARGGDLDAFERLVRRHRRVVYRVAARIVGDQDADDVTQDAFLRAFHGLEGFRGQAPFRSWLLRIAHNTALNALDQASRRPLSGLATEQVERALARRGATADGPPSPAAALESGERQARLVVKLRGLAPEHRAVLVLRDIEGLSYEEIAQVTDAPPGTVRARLHRARGELAEILRTNTYDWDLPR